MQIPPKETLIIGVFTAIAGSIMILRNIGDILHRVKTILSAYGDYWKVKSERERQLLEESRIRTAFWVRAIQLGIAEEKLRELNTRVRSRSNEI